MVGVGLRIGSAVLVAAVVGLVAAQASAQARHAARPSAADYYATIGQALSEYDAHNFEEALTLFAKAHALSPNARTLRGMAMAEYALRRYVECIGHLRLALDSTVKPFTGSLRLQAEELLRKAQQYVSRVTVQVAPANANASVTVDGAAVVLAPDGTLSLQVGERMLEVQAEGFETERRKLLLQGGDEQTLSVALRREASAAPQVPAAALTSATTPTKAADTTGTGPQDDGSAGRHSVWKSPWLWTGAGALVAGAIVTVALLSGGQPSPHVAGPITTPNTPPGVVVMALH